MPISAADRATLESMGLQPGEGGAATAVAPAAESPDQRLDRILWEVMSGTRSLMDVRRSVDAIAGRSGDYSAPNNDAMRMAAGAATVRQEIAKIFSNRGVSLTNYGSAPTTTSPQEPKPSQSPQNQADQMAARTAMENILATYGLNSPSMIAWIDELVRQGYTQLPILQLYEREEFKARFPALHLRRERGLAPVSVEEIIQFERMGAEVVKRWGLPQLFGERMYLQEKLADGWSMTEFNDRIVEGWAKVSQADASVRAFFDAQFGDAGEVALASFFLDPDRTLPELERVARAAEVGGAGGRFGVGLGRERAMRLADLGFSGAEAAPRFQQLGQIRGLFNETVEEQEDLTLENEGVDLAFGVDGIGEFEATNRLERRRARFGGGGGAVSGGLGSAR